MTDATRADANRFDRDDEDVDVVGPRDSDEPHDGLIDPDRDETTLDTPATDDHDTALRGTGREDLDDERVGGDRGFGDRDASARHALDDDTTSDDDTTVGTGTEPAGTTAGTATGPTDTGIAAPDTAAGTTATTGATAAPAGATATTGTATTSTATTGAAATTPGGADLLPANDVDQYQTDWHTVQSGFVDDPAGAVRDADALVGRLVDTITNRISEQRSALSKQRSDDAGEHTEQLRQALRDYRTMFQQLLPAQRP
jgi:hypothetical protein